MKRISSAAMMLLLFAALAGPVPAQEPLPEQEIIGKKFPPLESLAAFASETADIQPGSITFSRRESRSLSRSQPGDRLTLPALDQHIDAAEDPLEFRRIELFAPGARVMVLSADGAVEWQRDARQFFIATNQTTGVALAVDVETGNVSGFAAKSNSKMQLTGKLDSKITMQAIEEPPEAVSTCSMQLDEQPAESLLNLNSPIPESQSAALSGSSINYQAVVAIDADNEWMAGKGNQPGTAMAWITDAFLAMNVFYERDVETRLLIGDVILRTTPDPYSIASGPSDQMNEFATYWRNHMSHIDRNFAAMLSGRGVPDWYYSGIAWLDQYCQKGGTSGGRTYGSYSFNAIGVKRSAASTALYIGHEIGHNMGSPHTHCFNPVIDQCFNGEGGCYSGSTVSCPAGGRGTVMSYCHVSGSNGADCGASKSEFHSRVQSLIENRLATNSPGCIAAYEEPLPPDDEIIFSDGFEPL